MGRLIEGRWTTGSTDTDGKGGRFVRTQARFRDWVTAGGEPGPTGVAGFPAEAGRYHLYVSLACPWAHRTIIFRRLKELDAVIGMSIVAPKMPDEIGWTFTLAGSTGDPINGAENLADIYRLAAPSYTGRVTVPVLWDKERRTIVSNESADIVRMFNSAFDAITHNEDDFYPMPLRSRIDEINTRIYETVNNGVYRAGFARTQEAYEEAVLALFESLDWIEDILSQNAYLCGGTLTEADWRLFTTLVRFDGVYYAHFKCNIRQIADYPNISHYLDGLYHVPGVRETVDLDQIKTHYYWSQTGINPMRIVPVGPTPAYMR